MYHESKTCGTCRFWGQDLAVDIKIPGSHGELITIQRAPCLRYAVEPDAGDGAIVMLGPDSHCQCHADLWRSDYVEPVSVYDGYGEDDFGCVPGVDFPATLYR